MHMCTQKTQGQTQEIERKKERGGVSGKEREQEVKTDSLEEAKWESKVTFAALNRPLNLLSESY